MLKRSSVHLDAATGYAAYGYPSVTRNGCQIQCITSIDTAIGSAGEAFVTLSPDGG